MDWLNLKVSTLRSPQYVGCEPSARAAWLNVLAYCIEQENGGRLIGAATWKDRQWQQTCGVMLEEVRSAAPLLQFSDGDLIVWNYPVDKESEVKTARENGRKGGRPKTQEKPRNNHVVNPNGTQKEPRGITEGEEEGEGESPERGKRKPNPLLPTSPTALRLSALFNRRPSTAWDLDEVKKFKEIGEQVTDESLSQVEAFYRSERAKGAEGHHRRRLAQLLNHFQGEVDKAREYCIRNPRKSQMPRPPEGEPGAFRAWLASTYPEKAAEPWAGIPECVRSEFRHAQKL